MTEQRTTQPEFIRLVPIPPASSRLWDNTPRPISSSDQTLRHPEGRTAATDKGEDDEYSDENIQRWLEEDKLDPELAEWVRATLGE